MKRLFILFSAMIAFPFTAAAQPLPFGDVPPGIVKPTFGCGATVDSEASRRRCAKKELQYIDRRLNTLYHELKRELRPHEIPTITSAQREWVRQRDVQCELDGESRDRDAWLTYIASSPTRTNCVLHTTVKRVEELEKMRYQLETTPALAEVTPSQESLSVTSGEIGVASNQSISNPVVRSVHSYRNGKYYFEMVIERAGVPNNVKADIVARISDARRWTGVSYELRPRDLVLRFGDQSSVTIVGGDMGKDIRIPKTVIGIAADLDASRLYYNANGVWQNGAPPGSPKGVILTQNSECFAEVSSESALLPLIEKGIVKVNFGDTPFENRVPIGYQGFDGQKAASGDLQKAYFPGVYSINDRIASDSQVHWIRRYWEWVRSFRSNDSPSLDTTGYRCGTGQSGPVWFLTGSQESAPVRRECRVPEGKIILVPIINVLAQSRTSEQLGCDRLQVSLSPFNKADNLRLKVNGTAIGGLDGHFMGTGCFSLHDSSSAVAGPAVGAGYWVFTKPLKKGRYEIEFGGRYPADNYTQDIRYVLYVE